MKPIWELPDEWRTKSAAECEAVIRERRETLGDRLVILCHHYQRPEIVPFGDFLGDSFELSRNASKQTAARFIVFCGVHFMAESASILAGADQTVYLPNPYAGCPMADMAPEDQVTRAWEELGRATRIDRIRPMAYMNSAARLKAFCGRNGGLICTSGNADRAFDDLFSRADKIFFFPDEHLGRNTAHVKGIPADRVILWDPARERGGLAPEEIERAAVILWKGHCHVHMNFTREQIAARRAELPSIRIIVHPECRREVVAAADEAGSTKRIVEWVAAQPAGSILAIGTELNLVSRLIAAHPEKKILPLSPDVCPMCVNMWRTSLNDLAYTLSLLETGGGNVVSVPEPIRSEARQALDRMLLLA